MFGLSAVTSISERCSSSADRALSASMPTTQLSVKLRGGVGQQADRLQHVVDDHRLENVELEWPLAPAIVTATLLPMTCAHTMVMASAWVGLTLPGMIDEPGSFSGRMNSPKPERGPSRAGGCRWRSCQRTASTLSAPLASTIASCAASASNLFGAVTNGRPVICATSSATRSAKPGCALRPVPTAVPP